MLTVEQVQSAKRELPPHRRDLREAADSIIKLLRGGVPVEESAPAWKQIKNVVFISKIDVGEEEEE